jgi:membrane protein DedA with SNARE-associated domain
MVSHFLSTGLNCTNQLDQPVGEWSWITPPGVVLSPPPIGLLAPSSLSVTIRSVDDMLNHLMPLVSSPWLYLVVFATVAIDGFLPFIPIEAGVIGLGALSATGRPNLLALAAAVTAGGMAGDRVTYLIGRTAGGRLRHRGLVAARNKAQRALGRHGGTAILIGRFLPWGRSATALTAGSVSLPLGRFTLFTGLASAAWAAYAIGLGRLGGATFAGSPLLGAASGMALGLLLGGVHLIVEKVRVRRANGQPRSSRVASCTPGSRHTRARLSSPARSAAIVTASATVRPRPKALSTSGWM